MHLNISTCRLISLNPSCLRSLDGDLATLAKAGEPFDWERISFILEARGSGSVWGSAGLLHCFMVRLTSHKVFNVLIPPYTS